MELTPIRIPGKRRRKGEPRIVFGGPRRKEKRGDKPRKKQKVLRPKASSYLETELPLEIMERIFWMSENINFAKSGPRVGHLLSGEPTRRETFLQAFGPTWDLWFGCIRADDPIIESYYEWQDDSARFGGNPQFQSDLLQYSWASISFILDCMDSWVHRFARHRFFQHYKIWGNPETPHGLEDDLGGFGSYTSARRYFQHDFDAFCSQTGQNPPPPESGSTWMEVHRETRIPDALLTGPWDEAATQKLFWLVRAGARLSDDQTWETTLEGYHNATGINTVSTNGHINLPVVRLLFLLSGSHWPSHIANSELQKLQGLEVMLRDHDRRDAYQQYAYIAAILLRTYSNATSAP